MQRREGLLKLEWGLKQFIKYPGAIVGVLLFLCFLYMYLFAYVCYFTSDAHREPIGRIAFFADPQMEGKDRVKAQGLYGT